MGCFVSFRVVMFSWMFHCKFVVFVIVFGVGLSDVVVVVGDGVKCYGR